MGDGTGTTEASWLNRWLEENYSWSGLTEKPSWGQEYGENLQEFLRKVGRDILSDEDLVDRGMLLSCGGFGLFHVLFIPQEWVDDPIILQISGNELLSRQEGIWKLFRERQIKDRFSGTISGVHLPSGASSELIRSTRASFSWVSFQNEVAGLTLENSRSFTSCRFNSKVNLTEPAESTRRVSLNFSSCLFQGDIKVNGLKDVYALDIFDCTILGRFDFSSCGARVNIRDSEIWTFDSINGEFSEEVSIFQTKISGRVSLGMSVFNGQFSVISTDLCYAIELLDCDFRGRVSFSEVAWPPLGEASSCAEGSKFLSTVSFSGRSLPAAQFFHNAEFSSAVTLAAVSDKILKKQLYNELFSVELEESSEVKTRYAARIEGGCRVLRKIYESVGDIHQEHLWHRAEIIARRARGDASVLERGFSLLYGLFADYGLSIARPLCAIVVILLLFSSIYAWIGGNDWFGRLDWKAMEEGFGYSLNRTFPIGVFSDDKNLWRQTLLGSGGEIRTILIRILATSQSIISAVLIYLGVMAIRRKFRIS